jgi:lipopolysaccharide/colanic/teichoic acid biosynthesis glycosyltransferase
LVRGCFGGRFMSTESSAVAPPFETGVAAQLPAGSPQLLHPPLHKVRPPTKGERRRWRLDSGTSLLAGEGAPLVDALPLQDFRKELEREKRRSDRSKAPLSLVLFQIDLDARRTVAFLEDLHRVTRQTDVVGHVGNDLIALLCPDTDATGIRSALRKIEASAQGHAVRTTAVVTHPNILFDRISSGELTGEPAKSDANVEAILLSHAFVYERLERNRLGYALKRVIDVVGALAGMVLLSPLMLLAGLAVRLTSRGPIIFRQTRLGQGGKPFTFYKFRSMVAGGDDRIHRAYVADFISGKIDPRESSAETAARFYKLRSDPRITAVGRFIRKTSIDELPQLWNVFKGDMSLVGPRPPVPYEASRYQAWHLHRLLSAKPGITGLWQVEGRSKVSFDEMVRMDLRYIRDCSLNLDLRILAKTVKVVLRCEGAA